MRIEIVALSTVPEVRHGDDLAALGDGQNVPQMIEFHTDAAK